MLKQFFTSALGLFIATFTFAQNYNPQLIEDMMDDNRTSDAAIHYLAGDLLYVSGQNANNAYELKVINLKDSSITSTGITSKTHNFSQKRINFFEYKGKTHFVSNTNTSISTVWSTDGTKANTKELFTNKFQYNQVIATTNYLILNVINDSLGKELYVSDGTDSGTKLLKDIYKGYKDAQIQHMTNHNGMVYFVADDSTHGKELWKTDGTTAGTVMVKDLNTDITSSNINYINSFKSELYFAARNPSDNKTNVFRTNQSDTSFITLLDASGDPFYTFNNVTICDSVMYFGGNQTGKGVELCRTNGSQSGTYMIKDLDNGSYSSSPEQITCMNGLIYFVADYDKGKELYYTDGTASGTRLTQDLYPIQTDAFITNLTALNSVLVFSAHSSGNYYDFELYSRKEGSSIKKVKDIYPGSTASRPSHFFTHNNLLYFTADDGATGREIWISDGTSSTTKLFWDLLVNTPDNVITSIAETPEGVVFNANNNDTLDELWSFNLDAKKVKNVIDYKGQTRGQPRELMSTPNGVYYSLLPGSFDMEINYYDYKTKAVTEILDNGKKNYVGNFRRTNGKFFYTLRQTLLPNIWVYDETTKKTRVVTSAIQPNGFGADAANLTVVGDRVFFSADNYTVGFELYVTDGVTSKLVKDIYNDYYDSRPSNLCSFKDSFLFLSATTPKNGRELYFSDGTSSGTVMLKDIVSGSGSSSPTLMTEGNGLVFFVATDATNGRELWKSDGTENGTTILKDIVVGTGSSNPANLQYHPDLGKLFFTTTDSNSVETLWATDGSVNGTTAIRSFVDTTFTSNYSMEYAKSSDKMFFTARTDSTGLELWSTTGTSASIVSDLLEGPAGSEPKTLTMANGYLYFTADDEVHGRELWYMNASCLKANMTVIDAICAGDSIHPSVSVVSLFDTKSLQYNWYLNDSLMSSTSTYEDQLDSTGTYTLRLEVSNDQKCESSSSQELTVYGFPKASFTINQDTQCFKVNNYVFTNGSTGDNVSYAWNFGDNTTQTTTSPSKKYSKAGAYSIRLIASEAGLCSDTTSGNVFVSAEPATSAIHGPSTSDNDEEDFTANASPSNTNKFEWSVTNGTIVSGQGTKGITVKWNVRPTTGIIKLIETSPEGCAGNQVSKTCKVSRNASIGDIDFGHISIWPNPSDGNITIEIENANLFNTIEVMDYLGKVIYVKTEVLETTSLDLNLPSGVYFLKLSGASSETVKRIVIQK
ncbi:MAG: ELWxxDGT repeat protein [Bacteroidia bacterium]|jgi:ELWxxDGT repeat protein